MIYVIENNVKGHTLLDGDIHDL